MMPPIRGLPRGHRGETPESSKDQVTIRGEKRPVVRNQPLAWREPPILSGEFARQRGAGWVCRPCQLGRRVANLNLRPFGPKRLLFI